MRDFWSLIQALDLGMRRGPRPAFLLTWDNQREPTLCRRME